MKCLRLWVCALFAVLCCSGSDLAERLYKAGQRAERSGDTLQAYLWYARAAALEPGNATYAARQSALRFTAALNPLEQLAPDPAHGTGASAAGSGQMTGQEMLEARQALPPPVLTGSPGKKSFDLKGDARTIFETVAAAYGLLLVFDSDYQPPPPFTFRMADVGYQEALRALETVANSFLVPLSPRFALVARDTPQKRTERAPVMAVEIPIPGRISAQEAQEIITAVQQTLDIRRITVDPTRHVVFLRDQAAKVEIARRMFETLARMRPQVEVDVEFLSMEKNSTLHYGMSFPTTFPLVNFGHFLNNTPAIPQGFTNFLAFGGGTTLFGIGITQAATFATVSKNSSANLLHAQIVSLDGQAATLHVGNRYPIITAGYYGNATGTGQVYTPPPTVNYEDLGLVLKVTPSVHDGGEITLDLEADFEVLGAASSISGIPVISSRKYNGKVRLRNDEWAVLAGLIQFSDSMSRNGVPGFSLPVIGNLLSENQKTADSTDVLLVLKPRLVSLPPWEFVSQPIWVGSETRPVTLY